jgi:uncharacterized protein with FMN-binding domain
MKRIVLFVMTTVTVLVLLFGYHTSTSSRAAAGDSSVIAPVSGSSTTEAPTTTSAASAASSTVLGDSTDTRWGPVQVQITVQDGKITAVSVPVYPDNNGRDQQINATALPTLVQETLSAQSADIDMVSGATVTSDGYVTSLQSALDKAGL